jgi:hypothetical protein
LAGGHSDVGMVGGAANGLFRLLTAGMLARLRRPK